MGSLPFRIPGDTPYPRGDHVNRFTIDDIVESPAADPLSPGVLRPVGPLGPFANPAAS
jgi:hypothetical protein